MNSIGNKPDLMHKVVDKPQRADKQADLDATTVGKRSHIAVSHQSLLPLQLQLSQRRWLQRNAEALEPLVQHTTRAAMKGHFGSRALANVAYGAASVWKSVGVGKSGRFGVSLSELLAAIAKEAKQCLHESNAQDLANTAWAFATVGQKDELLFNVVARMAERHLDQFNARELAITAWALTDSAACMLRS